MSGSALPRSTTVSRALDLLHLLAERPDGATITELARELGTQRPPLYRIVGSLIERGLVHRAENGRYVLGAGLLELTRPLQRTLSGLVAEPLQRAANEADAGAVLVLETADGLLAAYACSPERPGIHLVTPVGHRFTEGPIAPRLVIEAQRARAEEDGGGKVVADEVHRAELDLIRERGYATSSGKALAGAWSVAFPVRLPPQYGTACVMLVSMRTDDGERLIVAGRKAADAIGRVPEGRP